MRIEELEVVCCEAARNLVEREGPPVPPSVVLPLPSATKVTSLPDFPNDDRARFELLSRFAAEVMVPANAPAWGFVAEAALEQDDGPPVDVVTVVFGARLHPPRITAAPVTPDGLGEFTQAEDLDPTALPFLQPLRHAADTATPPDASPGASHQ